MQQCATFFLYHASRYLQLLRHFHPRWTKHHNPSALLDLLIHTSPKPLGLAIPEGAMGNEHGLA